LKEFITQDEKVKHEAIDGKIDLAQLYDAILSWPKQVMNDVRRENSKFNDSIQYDDDPPIERQNTD
jgi:hypothetical protein